MNADVAAAAAVPSDDESMGVPGGKGPPPATTTSADELKGLASVVQTLGAQMAQLMTAVQQLQGQMALPAPPAPGATALALPPAATGTTALALPPAAASSSSTGPLALTVGPTGGRAKPGRKVSIVGVDTEEREQADEEENKRRKLEEGEASTGA